MTVKRYEFELYHNNGGEMLVCPDGGYVDYEDYAELQRQLTAYEATVTNLSAQVQGLAAENADLKHPGTYLPSKRETPITDAALEAIRNEARAEGINFTANRMLAAWDAGFIDSPAKEVIDVARMILSAADMLKDATEGDFSRKFADEIMAEMTTQLRKEQGNE